jgi:hypothetical protein
VAGVQGHLFDDAQLVSVVEAEPQQRDGVVKPGDRIEYRVHLTGLSPAAFAASSPLIRRAGGRDG